jgi:hypothetical protein
VIDNPKISSLEVRWQSFRGITTLLRNPGQLRSVGDLDQVWSDIYRDPELALYAAFGRAVEHLRWKELVFQYSICVVPPEQYHVTLGDGIHAGNLNQFREDVRLIFQRFLDELPGSFTAGLPSEIPTGLFEDTGNWRLRLRFRDLLLWNNELLVARLEPADEESHRTYEYLVGKRQRIDEALVKLGKEPLHRWQPHVTLAYLANRQLAAEAQACVPNWEDAVRKEAGDQVIEFAAFDLSCFLDMERFLVARREVPTS